MRKEKEQKKEENLTIHDEVKMLRSEVKRLRELVEMLMDIVVEMNDEIEMDEEYQPYIQPEQRFDINSAM